ncbi:MAG: NUDIX hydrolase [Candidatus Melainabacteria bacterium]|nr:NUDIX hydrolase [Candidatus Melainabacteria bacterium]
MLGDAEIMQQSERLYTGRVISLRVDEVRLAHGGTARREVVEHPGGVVAAPLLPDGRYVLVSQFRYPCGQTLLEFPAGKLERGEDPFAAIQRELVEETGYQAADWQELSVIYTAPGFCDEKLWLYRATNLSPANHHQPDADEQIQVVTLTPTELQQAIASRRIVDAKTLALWSLLQLH